MSNHYLPTLAVIRRIISENEANDIKTFQIIRLNDEKNKNFQYRCGQFAELSLFGIGECPIGIASSPLDDYLEFTVKKVGTVTTALHDCEEGATVGVRGPYGNGWPIEKLENHNIFILGGGFAFTTLRSLINYILHKENRARFGKITAIYGARDPGELIYKYDLKTWSDRSDIQVILTIDKPYPSWTGRVGFPNQIIKEVAENTSESFAIICGPPIMIKLTAPVLVKLGFSPENILTSLEMRMKCGLGVCGRCNVGNKYVCKDGPVFTYNELESMPKEY